MDNKPSTSKETLPKKVDPNIETGVWHSRIVPQKKSKLQEKTNKKRTKSEEKNSPKKSEKVIVIDSDSPSPKKRRTAANSSGKVPKPRKYLSPSAKLESRIPKVADLLKAREEEEKFKKIDKLIKKTSARFLKELKNNKNLQIEEKPKMVEYNKHCKDLTLNQLESRFRKDIKYIDGIFHGTIHSDRHEIFQKQVNQVRVPLQEDLRTNGESMGVFTNDQLVHIVTLFRERYDNGNRYKYSDYYFKVLLPEYCLKIFMDRYGMEKDKALDYLGKVPIPNLFGLS